MCCVNIKAEHWSTNCMLVECKIINTADTPLGQWQLNRNWHIVCFNSLDFCVKNFSFSDKGLVWSLTQNNSSINFEEHRALYSVVTISRQYLTFSYRTQPWWNERKHGSYFTIRCSLESFEALVAPNGWSLISLQFTFPTQKEKKTWRSSRTHALDSIRISSQTTSNLKS